MSKQSKTRRTGGRPPADTGNAQTAARLEQLLASDTLTGAQYEILTDELLELGNDTGVCVYSAEIVQLFFTVAAARRGGAPQRNIINEVLTLIEAGETFEGYESSDHLGYWKQYRKAKTNTVNCRMAESIAKTINDEQTPPEYRAEFARQLRALASVARTEYKSDAGETFLEATARAEISSRDTQSDAWTVRWNLLALQQGVRKTRPLASVTLRPISQPQGDEDEDDTAPSYTLPDGTTRQIEALRARFSNLYEAHDESARFAILREIYDLEQSTQTGGEEWLEVIGTGSEGSR